MLGFLDENYPSDTMVMVPYPLESLIIFSLMLIGVIFNLKYMKQQRYLIFYLLFVLLGAAPLLSVVYPERNFEVSTSLLPTRTFLLIPFICLFGAFGIRAIHKWMKPFRFGTYGVFIVFSLILCMRGFSHSQETRRFQEKISRYTLSQDKPAPFKRFEEKMSGGNVPVHVMRELHINQIYFFQLARVIKANVRLHSDNFKNITVLYLPEDYFNPDYYRYAQHTIPRADGYYFKMFLTFYLQEIDLDVSYLVRNKFRRKTIGQKFLAKMQRLKYTRLLIQWAERVTMLQRVLKDIRQPILKIPNLTGHFANNTGTSTVKYLIVTNAEEWRICKNAFDLQANYIPFGPARFQLQDNI